MSIYVKNFGNVWFGVAFEDETIYSTSFAFSQKELVRGLRESVHSDIPLELLKEPSRFGDSVIEVLKDVYEGKDVSYNFSFMNKRLSTYAQEVIAVVSRIPPGYVASYGGVARAAGGSPRAVGRVMASNPFAPLCPCHRVVGSDFSLHGYGGGLDVKHEFLKRETRGFSCKRQVEVKGGKLEIFPVEFVLNRVENSKR